MSDRERLIELLNEHYLTRQQSTNGVLADHLIAHGVTVQKHGRWVEMKAYPAELVCSECGCLFPDEKTPYCPNCGADMRGEA